MFSKLLKAFSRQPDSFESKFAELHATLQDPEAMFSGSAMLENLLALQPQALVFGENSAQLGRLYESLSHLQSKRGDNADTIDYGSKALSIHTQAPYLEAESLFYLNYRVFRALDEEGETEQALPYIRTCMQQLDSPWLSKQSQLGIQQEFGRILHDAGLFTEALASNQNCLTAAQNFFGTTHPSLCGVLNNLAQNHYELQQFAEAESFLQQRLQIAHNEEDHEIESDTLFQLGVLMFEQGQKAEAYALFEERIRRAKESGDEYLIHAAKEAMEELRSRDETGNT